MTNEANIISGLVALNGGTLVGKTRLQKTFFLLNRCGMNSDVDFGYHHFGPFSSDVADAADEAITGGQITSDERPGYHQVPYTIYKSASESQASNLGDLSADRAKELLEVLGDFSAIELEIASTILYWRENGFDADAAIEKTRLLKPLKASDKRIASANKLLEQLSIH